MSDASRFHRLEDLFREASALDVASRATFLEGIEEPEVRDELERLLQHTGETEVFIDQSPLQRGAPSAPVGTVAPGDRIGDFTITEFLAAGGMARVFRAETHTWLARGLAGTERRDQIDAPGTSTTTRSGSPPDRIAGATPFEMKPCLAP